MPTGIVKWFNNAKGYGFIRPNTGGDDLFVHYTYIEMDGYKTLKAGQTVEFEIQQAPKGLHAIKIRCHETEESKESQFWEERNQNAQTEVNTVSTVELENANTESNSATKQSTSSVANYEADDSILFAYETQENL